MSQTAPAPLTKSEYDQAVVKVGQALIGVAKPLIGTTQDKNGLLAAKEALEVQLSQVTYLMGASPS